MNSRLILIIALVTLTLSACGSNNTQETPTPSNNSTDSRDVVTEEKEDLMLELTLDELSSFDGKDGNLAYIAVDGLIYDVSDSALWQNGGHNGFEAGQDLTEAIKTKSPHGLATLKRVPLVGTLVEADKSSSTSSTEPNPETVVVDETTAVEETAVADDTAVVEETPVADDTVVVEETSTADDGLVRLTTTELAKYNGSNGYPVYIAYKGVIYDVTTLTGWSSGEHHSNPAGIDLTDDLQYAPHGEEKLKRATVVGELIQ